MSYIKRIRAFGENVILNDDEILKILRKMEHSHLCHGIVLNPEK